MKWFISYRVVCHLDFLNRKGDRINISFHNVVTDELPSEWMRKYNTNYNIMYAEQISEALASELVHGGPGVPAEYAGDNI